MKGSNDRPSNIGACNTASSPLNINPTDEANAPLIYAAISAKCSDDGQLVPESLARKAVAQYPIQIFDPPMQVPDIRWVMVWHDRSEIDAIVKWAINALIRCASTLLSPDQARSIS